MKISFQTLACPNWSWEKIVSEAVRMGYDGIEVRGVQGEMYLPKAKPFLPENIRQTMDDLKANHLEICCLDTSCKFHNAQRFVAAIEEGKATIDLAQTLGTAFIRVFGDNIPDKERASETIELVASGLQQLGQYAEGKGVTVLLETHGDFWNSEIIRATLEQVKSSAVGVLWDFEHPYKHGESPERTVQILGHLIKHTHVKDSKMTDSDRELCLIGEGDVPIEQMVQALKENGYEGWVSLEFEKMRKPHLEEPEISLPSFKRYIDNKLQSHKPLRVAIIGQGRSGKNIHAACLSRLTGKFKIVAVVDALEERRKTAEKEFGCTTYSHYQQLFDRTDLDFVVNASPSHLHVPITLDLLNHGFNVLCEKPLARRPEEVDSLIEASVKSGKVLGVFQNSRSVPVFMNMREVMDSGVLGRIVKVDIQYNNFARRWDWQTLQENNGGNLLNTGPHPVDQALQLFGDTPPQVTCFMDRANTFGDAEDYVKVILHGANRPVIEVEISSCCAYPSGFVYNVQGTQGGIKATAKKMEWKYFLLEEAPKQKLTRTPIINANGEPAYCKEKLIWHEESWEAAGTGDNSTHETFYHMFYNTIAYGLPLEITPQQVRQQIVVMEQSQKQNPHIYQQ
jgi:predicted dehydrogenase/sugar phosphate isomerase/epimerase